jgi:hypothetical protein
MLMSDIVPVLTEAIRGTEAHVKRAAHNSLAKANACQTTEPEHILRAVIDKYDRARIGSSVVEDLLVEPKAGVSLASVSGYTDFVKQEPVCQLGPEMLIIGRGDI